LKSKDWLAFILLGTIWGSSFLWIKIAVQEVGPALLVALRLLFGVLTLLVVALFTRPEWPRRRQVWLSLALLGIINNAIPYSLISWGEQYIDSSVAAVLNSTTPLFTMIIAHRFLTDDRMTSRRIFSLLMGFAGVFILLSKDLTAGFHGSLAGQLAVLLASVSYAISSVFARRTTKGLDQTIQAIVPLIGADVLMWSLASAVDAPITLPAIRLTWVAILWLGVMGTGLAFLLYFYLLHSVGPTRTALVTYVFPLVAVILGVVFLNESLDWQLAAGAVLIIASVVLVNRRR
jgi:drug/metabolite transporter (DMT)-like permease